MRYLPILALTILTACSGTMTGQVRGTGEKVQINFEEDMGFTSYTTQIGTENFSGKAVPDGATTYTAWGPDMTPIYGSGGTNKVIAVLLGDQGSSLNCQMRYADSMLITASGGVGVCKHSNGQTIDIVW
ncbi:hypothetical protein [Celeribacter baekdonensis]|jgi:hypothetical protein|uniref:hypothetical protein n=1 Tax=Celeribacter baekdonensis TaxID=875171 RepID=UPI0026E9B5C5|nr:hypothetical protein [Celeribacter baekdonensis]